MGTPTVKAREASSNLWTLEEGSALGCVYHGTGGKPITVAARRNYQHVDERDKAC
jgi:hypothetical protein